MLKQSLFILGLLICSHVVAQEGRDYRFTLEEAVNFAFDSNYMAINARRDIAKAIKQKWETTATGLPQIDASVAYQNNLKQPVVPLPVVF